MTNDPAAYERAKAAYLAEEGREGGAGRRPGLRRNSMSRSEPLSVFSGVPWNDSALLSSTRSTDLVGGCLGQELKQNGPSTLVY